ncbi:MAG: NUMOD3 domain-containing DNA-binding protein [Bacilli bacterium]|nr:NUMOD3 domain-containing DNA-binding protein [Bacilli bacterium]
MNNYLIYKYTSPSGKSYIGQTCNLRRRLIEHKNKNGCIAFHNAILKYGFENFIEEILEENLTLEEANERESYWIKTENTLAPNGYNLHTGGLNHTISEETRKRMSEAKQNISEETLRKMSISATGRIFSEETLRKMREVNSGENNGMFNKTHSEDTRNLMRDIKNKSYIITFPDGHEMTIIGLKKFCIEHNLDQGVMANVTNGKK